MLKIPEGVEVELRAGEIRNFIRQIDCKTIIGISWDEGSKYSSRYKGKRKDLKGLEYAKLPITVDRIFSIGKLIIMKCINAEKEIIYLSWHLGMTGSFNFGKESREKHSNLWIKFGNPLKNYEEVSRFYFTDARKFGSFSIYKNLTELLKKNGPCLMSAALIKYGRDENVIPEYAATRQYWNIALNKAKNTKPIAEFMMEQKYVSGIGNYLRAEILYACKIDPERCIRDLSVDDKNLLYDKSLEIIFASWSSKGPSKKYFKEGSFQLQVYSRKFDNFNNQVLTYVDTKNRVVHYVPAIQV